MPRLLASLRAITLLVLCWRVMPRIVRPALRLLLGKPPHLAPHSHVLLAGALLRNEIATIVSTLVATGLVLLTERGGLTPTRLIARSNLPRAARGWQMLPVGLLAGCAAMGTVIGAIALTGHAHIVEQTASTSLILRNAAAFAFVFLLVGIAEEWENRGYALRSLTEGIGFWPASLLISVWFGYTHLAEGDPWFGALGTGLRSLFECLMWRVTGSLAFAFGFHAAWDGTETVLFGVPDSSFTVPAAVMKTSLDGPAWLAGGTVGPEGSIFAYAVTAALLAWALSRRTSQKRGLGCGA